MKLKGNKKLALTLIVLGVIMYFFGGSLAYWNWETSESQKTAVTVTVTKEFECSIDGGGTIESSNYQLIPTGCTDPNYAIKREVTVSPTLYNTENNVVLDMWIDVKTLNSGLSNSRNFKYALTTSSTSCTSGVVSSGTFHNLTNNSQTEIILNKTYPQTTNDKYYLYIWLDSIESDPSTMEQSFSLSLNGQCRNASKGEQYYVVYSETDNSLRFYDNEEVITEGSTYNNLVATKVYTAYENDEYLYDESTTRTTTPWDEKRDIVTKIVVEDEISPGSTANWFTRFIKVSSIDVAKLNTSNVTSMSRMFDRAGYDTSVTSFSIVGLNDFDTSNTMDMSTMFQNAGRNATTWNIGDLSEWNVSKVVNFTAIFNKAGKNATTWNIGDLSEWDVSNVNNMRAMFLSAGESASSFNLGDLDNWNVSKATNMANMFDQAGYSATTWNIGDLSNWNVSNVTNMYYMFSRTATNATMYNIGNLNNWNTSNVTNMFAAFSFTGTNATTWNIGDISSWDVSKVTTMRAMFENAGYSATTFNIGNLNNWDVSSVTDMSGIFHKAGYSATTFNIGDLSNWKTTSVINMSGMFERTGYNALTFNIGDISKWNTLNVTNMSLMFEDTAHTAKNWSLDLSRWNVNKVTEHTDFNNGSDTKVTSPTWVS